ncbi:MAG: hypothetical protein P8Z50_08500 [candidate division WOR-3 bacterium]|jgi:hypothetical protein
MKKIRNEKAFKVTITAFRDEGGPQPKVVRLGLVPGLNRVSDEDWETVIKSEQASQYVSNLRKEGVLDFEGDIAKISKKNSKKGKDKKGKESKSSDIDGL